MSIRVLVPELLREARGKRSMDAVVAASGKKFTKAIYHGWENGRQPKDANKIALCDALGVKWEKISLPIDKVPPDSKFFRESVQ